ncbi:Hypothetical predicted protein [Xyrichtys novacula]|uniref:Uncharacterized protein n=1 Tax=Xyrichtys novacula TaxID=13765 RepID=A0AAV1GPR3_XYRNO|nr:Hypothetical predicted protein [Xyrichtys novacula]
MRGEAVCQRRKKKKQRRSALCGRRPSGHLAAKRSFSSEVTGSAAPNVAASHRRTSLKKTRPLNSVCPLCFSSFFYRLNPKGSTPPLPGHKAFFPEMQKSKHKQPPMFEEESVSEDAEQN